MSSTPGTPFDFGTRLGLVFIIEAAFLSALAVTWVLLYIGYSAVKIKRGASRKWSTQTHIHWFFLNLMIFDLIQAAGGLMDIKWVAQATVTEGRYCTAQGVLKQTGDVGVALTCLAIAVHTCGVLVFQWKSPPITALLVIGFIWIFIALIIGITFATHKGQVYYGVTQYWCWITARYPSQRIALEYLWLWITAFVDLVVYASLALILKGFIIVNRGSIRFTTSEDRVQRQFTSSQSTSRRQDSNSVAMRLLFYPAVYIITVLPIAVVRWTTFSNANAYVPFAATAFADALFASSGLLNVILFALTRPKVLPSREVMVLDTSASPFGHGQTRAKRSLTDYSNDDIRDAVETPISASFSPRDKYNSLIMQLP
ncbi:hypothetical protein PILCRDRAFT_827270 [Piloderma croceum F 1598]|uniref:Glucose receptor Git3 N-terminal domain-containing protein n=1 Tax=Piloderma croceum (strain F 1598) TaxID=765440 RepID=A0A0C3AN84_PILCF|nr:hypothetical protein PILCRDRAFT_827270 [Piloderma croceum F 1598]